MVKVRRLIQMLLWLPIIAVGCSSNKKPNETDSMTPNMFAVEAMMSAVELSYFRDGVLPTRMAEIESTAKKLDGRYGEHARLSILIRDSNVARSLMAALGILSGIFMVN